MNKTLILLGLRKNNEVVNIYPTISAQETKHTNKKNKQTSKQTNQFTNLNRLMWDKKRKKKNKETKNN